MDYELAKQLKDADYPQVWNDNNFYYLVDETIIKFPMIKHAIKQNGEQINFSEKLILIPTLSDLISRLYLSAICDFFLENEWGKEWIAKLMIDIDLGIWYEAKGKTPEEAIAKLWLEYHK